MNKSKKLFNSEDFDKKKPLFESKDFDKLTGESQNEEQRRLSVPENDPSSGRYVKSSKAKIIGGLVAAVVIIVGGVFFVNNSNDNSNNLTTETVSQVGKEPTTGGNDSTTELNGKTEAVASSEAEEKPAVNEAKPISSVADESHVATSTEKSSTSPSENSDNNVDGDVETNARRVIRGDFDNGQVRKDRLGSSYSEIQGRVNEMYRQGLVR